MRLHLVYGCCYNTRLTQDEENVLSSRLFLICYVMQVALVHLYIIRFW